MCVYQNGHFCECEYTMNGCCSNPSDCEFYTDEYYEEEE